ncbi:hypothetical protein ATCC90586_010035 [Pythium insidiosum]|nr:hypothetical protein ATCC90586_010035 [Pythium insidiosum]
MTTEGSAPSPSSASSPSSPARPTSALKSASPKKTVGWAAVLKSQILQHRQDEPTDATTSSTGAPAERASLPNEAIFNTQFTTAGRKFLSKVKKNRAMQLDRRTKGFQQGQANGTVKVDAITKRHYRLLLVDPDLPRREDLADALEQYFEVLVAATNERALALLAMFKKVDLALLRLSLGNDHSTTTSPTLEFLRDARRKQPMLPIALLTPSPAELAQHSDLSKLLGQSLQLGACGFFEDDDASLSTVDALVERLTKLLHSLVLAQRELVQCRRKSKHGRAREQQDEEDEDEDFGGPKVVQAMLRRGTSMLTRRPATSKPATLTYDKEKMLLELSLKQRRQCISRRKQLHETLQVSHSVLGLGLGETSGATPGDPAPSLLPSASAAQLSTGPLSLARRIPPLPTPQQISHQIYTKPHELQGQIDEHVYATLLTSQQDAQPQDPLLRPCVAVNPDSVSRSGSHLLVGKAFQLYLDGRYAEALQQCARAIRLQDNNLVKYAYLLRGVVLDVLGDVRRAEQAFQTCLALDPALHQAHFNLSVCHLKMGRDELALREVSTALHLAPTVPDYLRNRALIYRRLGEFGLAQSEYSKLEGLTATQHNGHSSTNALTPPAAISSFAKAASSAALLSPLLSHADTSGGAELEDGLFTHLFGRPTDDKLALVTPPAERSSEQLELIVLRLQSLLFFQDFPATLLRQVAELLEYEVVACGKDFALGTEHPQNFYVLFSGRLSVRRHLGDFASAVTTHHIDAGAPFGCAGHMLHGHSRLLADESSEIGILWPEAFDATIHSFCTSRNNELFQFLQQLKAFKLFSTSELGHIIGISERRRFRKGELVLAQNALPSHLIIIWKGACLMLQDFTQPPLRDLAAGRVSGSTTAGAGDNKPVLPFHRLLAQPDWPLGFHVEPAARKKKHRQRHGRRNAMVDPQHRYRATDMLLLSGHPTSPGRQRRETGAVERLGLEVIRDLGPGAIIGESMLLEQDHARAKCSVVADSVVEVLLFDHLRLQEMELAPEVIAAILQSGPEYVDEDQVIKRKMDDASWREYKNLRLLELSKHRWPDAKAHEYRAWGGDSHDTSAPLPHGQQYGLSGARAALLDRDTVVVVGGRAHPTDRWSTAARVDLFDLSSSRWRSTVDVDGSLPRRVGHSVVRVANGPVVVFGGEPLDDDIDARKTRALDDCFALQLQDNPPGRASERGTAPSP